MKAYKKTKRMKKSSLSGLVPTSSQTPKGGEMERESGGGVYSPKWYCTRQQHMLSLVRNTQLLCAVILHSFIPRDDRVAPSTWRYKLLLLFCFCSSNMQQYPSHPPPISSVRVLNCHRFENIHRFDLHVPGSIENFVFILSLCLQAFSS